MRYLVGFAFAVTTMVLMYAAFIIFKGDYNNHQFLVGWLSCSAFFAGVKIYSKQ